MKTTQYLETAAISKKDKTGRRGIRQWLGVALAGAVLISLAVVPVVEAVPKRIIILRHGEKHNAYQLCHVGQQRSLALRANYLGKDAANSLFPDGAGPTAIFTITLHTLELASPTALSWGLPLQLYSVVPLDLSKKATTRQLNQRTRQAAHAILTDPRWHSKTVVMVWEHDHIAKRELEKEFLKEKVTLRQLLHLDKLPDVPKDWPGDNYDYFWIVEYDNPGSAIPTKFTALKQVFPAPYNKTVPSNDWGKPENLPKTSGCEGSE